MAIIHGTENNDVLNGEANASNTISGIGGDDRLTGGNLVDGLSGGDGNDTLIGGSGNDVMNGGEGNDRLIGGADGDRLTGGNGDDTLKGGLGDDVLVGGDGADSYSGGDGWDLAAFYLSGVTSYVINLAGSSTGGQMQGDTFTADIEAFQFHGGDAGASAVISGFAKADNFSFGSTSTDYVVKGKGGNDTYNVSSFAPFCTRESGISSPVVVRNTRFEFIRRPRPREPSSRVTVSTVHQSSPFFLALSMLSRPFSHASA